MSKTLSAEQVASFERDGFVFPTRVLAAEQGAACVERLSAMEAARGYRFTKEERRKPHLLLAWLDAIAHSEEVLDAVEDVLGPDILFVSSSLFIKEPGSESYIGWHQDAMYWPLEPMRVVTAWVALTASHIGNGCVRMARGSHRRGVLPHVETDDERNTLSRRQSIDGIEEAQAVDIVLAPGEMSLHDFYTAHASGPNPSAERRIGFAARYIPPYLRQTGGPAMSACLARGEDRYRHFEPEPRPAHDFDPAAVAYREALLGRHAATQFSTL